ncbi:MAG: hypothetical protein KAZ87_04440 [Spirochaetes bacterium]|nr:hypothetical protein [Spirochaetota bacterium]
MKSRRNYDTQFRKYTVALVEKTGKSVSEAALNLGISNHGFSDGENKWEYISGLFPEELFIENGK